MRKRRRRTVRSKQRWALFGTDGLFPVAYQVVRKISADGYSRGDDQRYPLRVDAVACAWPKRRRLARQPMAAAMDVGVPQVPIDYTALLCRIPDSNATIPDPPSSLDFLHRILREKSHAFEEETEEDVPSEPNDEREDKHTLTNASHDDVDTELVPPDNFAMVNSWVYRSSFPKKKHFPFLKTLGLRSVLTLILEDYPEQNINFLDENGIKFFQYGIPGNKEPFVQSMSILCLTPVPGATITAALVTILDKRNHPMLIHCNKGKVGIHDVL